MRIELGGGARPRGDGWVNVDVLAIPGVDHVCDFEALAEAGRTGERLPFADDSVAAVYSSHCLEHVSPYKGLLHEVCRVSRVGATVEVRVPHWLSDMSFIAGHKHAVSPRQVQHWCRDFVADWWAGSAKRLAHERTEYAPSSTFAEAKALFWQLSDEQVMRFIPDAAHEVRYFFRVVLNAD